MTMTYPSTHRFLVIPAPGNPTSLILTILHRSPSGQTEFAHCWRLHDSGRWTMSRGQVCLQTNWRPTTYTHGTLEKLLSHLEETYPEHVLDKVY